mmetsp:Transcript_5286/g.13949  ORF Transcript_5286/g.13949 Transcript_5286/m.13949 type:complete len:85 (+) Transcript_5286:380-634(+)
MSAHTKTRPSQCRASNRNRRDALGQHPFISVLVVEWLVLEVVASDSVNHGPMDVPTLLRKEATGGVDVSDGIIDVVLLELSVTR